MTQNNDILTITLGNPAEQHQLAPAEAQRIISGYLKTGNYPLAASVSMQIANQLPNELWPHLNTATSLLMNQQIEPASRFIDRALEIDPNNVDCLIIKSRIHLNAGERE